MKKNRVFIFLTFFLFSINQKAQTVFWTETFNNACAMGCGASGIITATNGAWSVDLTGGCNDSFANMWYISCAENGNAVGACGTGCGANATLHMGSTTLGDIGAAYDAGGLGGCGSGGTTTFARAVSPNISTIGKSGISVSFDYLENGDGAIDDGWVEYSLNGGATWVLLINTVKTLCCGGGGVCTGFNQGKWGNYTSATLPAGANNIAGFKLRFVWQNNDDGIGTDPSYAINDLKIRYVTVLPIELANFSADQTGSSVSLKWSSLSEKNFRDYEIQRSEDGTSFSGIGTIKAAGSTVNTQYYNFTDTSPINGIIYYRLKMVDQDYSYKYSSLLSVDLKNNVPLANSYFLDSELQLNINKNFLDNNGIESLAILSIEGKIISEYKISDYVKGEAAVFPCAGLQNGFYLCRVTGLSYQKSFKIVVLK
jgi:hypothetical protein